MIFWIIGYIVIFIIVIALCKAAARGDKEIEDMERYQGMERYEDIEKSEDIEKRDDLKDINYKE